METFEQAIVGLLPRLRRFARALTRDMSDADDLTQIVIERALSRRSQWAPGTRLDSWLMRIMKNAWIDETRSRGRRGRVFAPEETGEHVPDPLAARPADRDDAIAVEQAMARLPDDQRLAVVLVLVEGLSYAEAAEVLEIPPGTLTSRLVRGRQALMAELQG